MHALQKIDPETVAVSLCTKMCTYVSMSLSPLCICMHVHMHDGPNTASSQLSIAYYCNVLYSV